MDRVLVAVLIGLILMVIAGWQVCSLADQMTTVLMNSGSSVLSTSVTGDTAYADYLFTDGRANVSRSVESGKRLTAKTRASADRSLGFDEYAGQNRDGMQDSYLCSLMYPGGKVRYDQVSHSGLFNAGEYVSAVELTNGSMSSKTGVNGTGMFIAKSGSEDRNSSEETDDLISGYMRLIESIRFGEEA